MPGTEKEIATYKRGVVFMHSPETVNRRQMLLLLNQHLRYHPDTMVSYLYRSKDMQLRDMWPTSSSDQDSKKGKDPKVELDTLKPPCHKLRKDIETKLEKLLKECQSQFTQDEKPLGPQHWPRLQKILEILKQFHKNLIQYW